jgi:hypothetical protein
MNQVCACGSARECSIPCVQYRCVGSRSSVGALWPVGSVQSKCLHGVSHLSYLIFSGWVSMKIHYRWREFVLQFCICSTSIYAANVTNASLSSAISTFKISFAFRFCETQFEFSGRVLNWEPSEPSEPPIRPTHNWSSLDTYPCFCRWLDIFS